MARAGPESGLCCTTSSGFLPAMTSPLSLLIGCFTRSMAPWQLEKWAKEEPFKFSVEQDIRTDAQSVCEDCWTAFSLIATPHTRCILRAFLDCRFVWRLMQCYAYVSFVDILADLYPFGSFLFKPAAAQWVVINPFVCVCSVFEP